MVRYLSLLASLLAIGCAQQRTTDTSPSLADHYSPYFSVGAAIDEHSYQTHRPLLLTHFNAVVTENELKFSHLQPRPGEFEFEVADKMINFARHHDFYTRGHALVWHRQTPDWVFLDQQGKPASPELLRQRMKNHIFTVMNHFKGRVDAWDVVNEAIVDNGQLRTDQESEDDQKSLWYGILGPEYIEDAFRWARQADPDAKLFYNDYYNYLPARRDAIYALLKELLNKGVPIDGVGLQCHLNVATAADPSHQSHYQTIENLEKAIQLYASLGLDVQITELDVSVYTGGKQYTAEDFVTPEKFDHQMQMEQAERYAALFAMFKRNSDVISNVTFWGIADDNTWLSEFDSGRQDFPMLFDLNHRAKPAFDAVIEVANSRPE